ncbi:DUF4844 domain-containing protein [Sediminicola sp. YIK13]|uniref:DUF4844 domain-containing protein n=1 Tax=Sediminicola sp. YIK13 TaxID=1453352 RepID=UPI0009E8343F|nr:DUF4844 domain-containing protein [Sediminicola sp. YIK13]
MTKYIQIFILFLTISACGQKATEMKTPKTANEQFAEFIAKKKFVEQTYPNYYQGITDEKMRPILTEKINQIASDFKNVAESENQTDQDYQEQIGIGLSRFRENYLELDTKDREMVCVYIEQLMDIVGLESSNGQLNKFMYGFDPMEMEKEERWTDEHGNVFIQKGNEVSIIPAKYEKTGKTYKVFIFNETSNEIQVSERLKIQPNEFKVFNMVDTDTLELNNGVKFLFGETYGLEIEDKKSQVSGLGAEFLVKYGVPDEAEWAFVIVPEGQGD